MVGDPVDAGHTELNVEINVVFVYPTRRLMWLTIVELDLLCRYEYKLQRDQHVSSSNTLLQDLVKCGSGLVFILSNQQCGIRTLQSTRWINGGPLKVEKRVDNRINLL